MLLREHNFEYISTLKIKRNNEKNEMSNEYFDYVLINPISF